MNFLEVENVSKSFAEHRALTDVSMEVPENSIFGLLGPNGAGKTTLIRIINQISMPDSGEVRLNGEKLKREHIAQIGYLPEERGLYKKMKIGEQLLYLARLRGLESGQALQAAKHWMTRLEMQSWWNKKAEELSKGMQQKVQLVAALMHDPDLLILDEPSAGLDPVTSRKLDELIVEIRAMFGTTIVVVSHELASIYDIADRVIMLEKQAQGIIAEGAPRTLATTSADPRVKEFLTRGTGKVPIL